MDDSDQSHVGAVTSCLDHDLQSASGPTMGAHLTTLFPSSTIYMLSMLKRDGYDV